MDKFDDMIVMDELDSYDEDDTYEDFMPKDILPLT